LVDFSNEYRYHVISDTKYNKEYGIKTLLVLSAIEDNLHSSHLIELDIINPAFIHKVYNTHYAIQYFKDPFADFNKIFSRIKPELEKTKIEFDKIVYNAPSTSYSQNEYLSFQETARNVK